MIKKHFIVPLYKTDVTVIQIEPTDTFQSFKKILPKGLNQLNIEEIEDCVNNYYDNWNGGWVMSNNTINSAIIIFTGFKNRNDKQEVIAHEKRHLEDKIAAHTGIKDDSEAVAYLAGWLDEQFIFFRDLESNIISNGNSSKKDS